MIQELQSKKFIYLANRIIIIIAACFFVGVIVQTTIGNYSHNIFDDMLTKLTVLITDQQPDGTYTVFMPTVPNPTSGNIYHVLENQVKLCPDVSLDSAMCTVIACGTGSCDLFNRNNCKNEP